MAGSVLPYLDDQQQRFAGSHDAFAMLYNSQTIGPSARPFGDGLNNNTVPYLSGSLQYSLGTCEPGSNQDSCRSDSAYLGVSRNVLTSSVASFPQLVYPGFDQDDAFSEKTLPQSIVPLPSLEKLAGKYNFDVSLPANGGRAATWIFSERLNKLYVRIASPCPIRVRATDLPFSDCVLRVTAVYTRPEHVNEPVRCCAQHQSQSTDSAASHLIRIVHPQAEYLEDVTNGRQCVTVPFQPQSADWTTVLVQFSCFSSCIGGQNRRPIRVVFSLERRVPRTCDVAPFCEVLGRSSLEVRTCACPRRDAKWDEELRSGNETAEQSVDTPSSSSAASSASGKRKRKRRADAATYTLTVRGVENFRLLKRIRDALELAESVQGPSGLANVSKTAKLLSHRQAFHV